MESWFPDTLREEGDFGVDAFMPMTGVNDWPRMRRLAQYSPIPEIQPSRSPIRSAQPELCCTISSPVLPVTETRDILTQLQSDVHTLKWLRITPTCSLYEHRGGCTKRGHVGTIPMGHTEWTGEGSLGSLQFSGKIGDLPVEVRDRGPTRRRGPVYVRDGTGNFGS